MNEKGISDLKLKQEVPLKQSCYNTSDVNRQLLDPFLCQRFLKITSVCDDGSNFLLIRSILINRRSARPVLNFNVDRKKKREREKKKAIKTTPIGS